MVRDYSLTMTRERIRLRLLQGVLVSVGVAATGTGLSVVAQGTAAVPGGGPVTPSVDSVLRFYAVWWAALGPVLWRLAPRVGEKRPDLAAVCGVVFLGGVARTLVAAHSGPPHPLFTGLTVTELTAPPALLFWQHSVQQRAI